METATSPGSSTEVLASRKSIRTVKCFLCGGNQIYPGPRFENHVINEHGIILDIDYVINLSLYKDEHGSLPSIDEKPVANGTASNEANKVNGTSRSKPTSTNSSQTEEDSASNKIGKVEAAEDDNDFRLVMDMDDDENADDKANLSATVSAGNKVKSRRLRGPKKSSNPPLECAECKVQFQKLYKFKLHNLTEHKQDVLNSKVSSTLEVLKCSVCDKKNFSEIKFYKHVTQAHNLTKEEYTKSHGKPEPVTVAAFECRLCSRHIRRTKLGLSAHMASVHRLTYAEYKLFFRKTIIKKRTVYRNRPLPIFECIICGASAKSKKDHLTKKHQMPEFIYDQLMRCQNEESKVEVQPKVFRCGVCNRDCLDLKKHLERTHQISEEIYEKIVATKTSTPNGEKKIVKLVPKEALVSTSPQVRVKPNVTTPSAPTSKGRIITLTPVSPPGFGGAAKKPAEVAAGQTQSATSSALSSEMKCYFDCDETFTQGTSLMLHLKQVHKTAEKSEFLKAVAAAEEEISYTQPPSSAFLCRLCAEVFNDMGKLFGHIQSTHSVKIRDYRERFGANSVKPFDCRICNRMVKYEKTSVYTHLKNAHGMTWSAYIEKVRQMRRGYKSDDDLPAVVVEMSEECRVCNLNVKNLRDHVRGVHKITEQEYENLFIPEPKDSPNEARPREVSILAPKKSTSSVAVQPVKPAVELMQDKMVPKPPKTDIQDKHNKRCSSCTITFTTRRSFIEHCTIVHGMTFRTKAGQVISAANVQETQRTEAAKRKPETEEAASPKRNKTGFTIEIDNAEHGLSQDDVDNNDDDAGGVSPPHSTTAPLIIGSAQRKTLFTPAGVSKWNQCKYECCFCKWTTMSRSSMTSHLHNTHGIPIQEYKKSNYPDIEVETNWFQCRLCSARTKFVKDCIAPHLKMSHGMDIDTYEREIMQPEDWPYEVIPEPSLRSEMRVPNSAAAGNTKSPAGSKSSGSKQKPAITIRPVAAEAADLTDERDKWNRCRYQCCLCETVMVDSRQMRIHIATRHSLTVEDYVKQFGSTEVVTKRFNCAICSSGMKFCRQNIYAHMKDVHKMTLADYEAKFGLPPDTDDGSGSSLPTLTVDLNDMSVAGGMDDDIAEPDQDEAMAQEMWTQPTGQSGMMDRGILDDGRKPSRWNKCRFRCAICNKLSSEKRHVREHIIKVHGLSLNEYESQYGECEIHTEYFFCGICHAEVKHNLKNIALHLNNVHNMTPQNYEAQYGRMPDEDVTIDLSAMESSGMNDMSADAAGGFGAHFMMAEGDPEQASEDLDDEGEPALKIDLSPSPKAGGGQWRLPNPPKADIINPKNKYCRVCKRDYNRRQAFVEHCRSVHKLKLRFKPSGGGATIAPLPAVTVTPAVAATPVAKVVAEVAASSVPSIAGGYPCDFCGKVFSNRSNRTRHVVLSCDVAKLQKSASNGSGSQKAATSAGSGKAHAKQDDDDSDLYSGPPHRQVSREPIHCPYPECDVVHFRTALMKRHLCDDHNDPNGSLAAAESSASEEAEFVIDGEVVSDQYAGEDEDNIADDEDHDDEAADDDNAADEDDIAEAGNDEGSDEHQEEDEEEEEKPVEKKVPPLRVKITGGFNSPDSSPTAIVASNKSPPPPAAAGSSNNSFSCKLCKTFKTNNSYIMSRHKKACSKKMRRQSREESRSSQDESEHGQDAEMAEEDDEEQEDA